MFKLRLHRCRLTTHFCWCMAYFRGKPFFSPERAPTTAPQQALHWGYLQISIKAVVSIFYSKEQLMGINFCLILLGLLLDIHQIYQCEISQIQGHRKTVHQWRHTLVLALNPHAHEWVLQDETCGTFAVLHLPLIDIYTTKQLINSSDRKH